jgi:hypothetical protein
VVGGRSGRGWREPADGAIGLIRSDKDEAPMCCRARLQQLYANAAAFQELMMLNEAGSSGYRMVDMSPGHRDGRSVFAAITPVAAKRDERVDHIGLRDFWSDQINRRVPRSATPCLRHKRLPAPDLDLRCPVASLIDTRTTPGPRPAALLGPLTAGVG